MFRYWSVAGFLLSRGPGCCICCFCLSPVGGSVISMQAVKTLQFCFEYSRSIDFFATQVCANGWQGAGAVRTSLTTSSPRFSPNRWETSIMPRGRRERKMRFHSWSFQAWGVVDWVEVWKAWVGSGLLPEATPFQEKREDEQRWLNRLTILLTILFCFRLSYTQPFRHSVVDGDGVYTGEDRVAKNGKIQQVF